MKTVQMTIDDALLAEVDRAVAELGTTRSSFTREALRRALVRLREADLEQRHRRGYERLPVGAGEFDAWDAEQVWPD